MLDRDPEECAETVYGTCKKRRLIAQALEEQRSSRRLPPSRLRVLDVGCGTGDILTIFLSRQGYDVVGIDTDARSIAVAKERAPGNLRLVIGDVCGLSEVTRYDAIVCSEVLEHLDAPSLLLKKFRELLRPDGRLIVTVPNGYGPFEWEDVLWKRCGLSAIGTAHNFYLALKLRIQRRQFREFFRRGLNRTDPTHEILNTLNPTPHVQFFTMRALRVLLEVEGFTVLSTANLSFLCGKVTQTLLGTSRRFVQWTTQVADRLPSGACSGWLLVCGMANAEPAPSALGTRRASR